MIGAKGRRGSGTMPRARNTPTPTSDRPSRPIILKGIAGSHGLAIGPAVIVGNVSQSFVRRTVKPHEVEVEIGRFSEAVARAQESIRQVVERVKSGVARAETSILDAYVQMLGDELVAEGVERNIRINRQNAEWAVSNAIQELCDKFEDMEDPYLLERRHDVAFVGERLLRALSGSDKVATLPKLTHPSVIMAHDLSPADTASLVKEPVVAIITEVGTRTSHTSIMARALEIPAVVGVADALGRIGPGDMVIVDGFRGEVTVAPTPEMIVEAEERSKKHIALVKHLREDRDRPSVTADDVPVHLRANIEFPAEALLAVDHGSEGIGLYRTEFLYVDRPTPPDEEEQYELYRAVLETVHPRPATLRTRRRLPEPRHERPRAVRPRDRSNESLARVPGVAVRSLDLEAHRHGGESRRAAQATAVRLRRDGVGSVGGGPARRSRHSRAF